MKSLLRGLQSHSGGAVIYFILGVEVSGTDLKAIIKVNLNKETYQVQATRAPAVPEPLVPQGGVIKVDYSTLQPLDIIQMATGYAEDNLWLQWMAQTARNKVGLTALHVHLQDHTDPLIQPLYIRKMPGVIIA
ncbi:hypothetical protein ILYODFUR_037344 [Ilyodon furcidens]|uniref:Uncharacterized protein n=1 Tax=Ilyodon furcidens TaxID=33524 RepID=A0ABV0TE98_9TELE